MDFLLNEEEGYIHEPDEIGELSEEDKEDLE